jgi:hypothetical protein
LTIGRRGTEQAGDCQSGNIIGYSMIGFHRCVIVYACMASDNAFKRKNTGYSFD